MKSPHHFQYKYNAGPLSLKELSLAKFTTGNCRRAIQDYFYTVNNLYLSPSEILLPDAYCNTGKFITKNGMVYFNLYKSGDIIYAERIKNKKNNFKSEKERIYHFHSAIYLGDNKIYHATTITKETCIWNMEQFNQYYKIIAVKRILPNVA